jgi:hypothetical protein
MSFVPVASANSYPICKHTHAQIAAPCMEPMLWPWRPNVPCALLAAMAINVLDYVVFLEMT